MRERLVGIVTAVLVGVVGVPMMATAAPIAKEHNDLVESEGR